MNSIDIFLFCGFILVGFLIGYPFGHIFGRREAQSEFVYLQEDIDILDAQILEENK